jgi:hypothetical protein
MHKQVIASQSQLSDNISELRNISLLSLPPNLRPQITSISVFASGPTAGVEGKEIGRRKEEEWNYDSAISFLLCFPSFSVKSPQGSIEMETAPCGP